MTSGIRDRIDQFRCGFVMDIDQSKLEALRDIRNYIAEIKRSLQRNSTRLEMMSSVLDKYGTHVVSPNPSLHSTDDDLTAPISNSSIPLVEKNADGNYEIGGFTTPPVDFPIVNSVCEEIVIGDYLPALSTTIDNTGVVTGKDDIEESPLFGAKSYKEWKCTCSGLHVHPDAISTCSPEVNFQRMNPSLLVTCSLVELHGWPPPATVNQEKEVLITKLGLLEPSFCYNQGIHPIEQVPNSVHIFYPGPEGNNSISIDSLCLYDTLTKGNKFRTDKYKTNIDHFLVKYSLFDVVVLNYLISDKVLNSAPDISVIPNSQVVSWISVRKKQSARKDELGTIHSLIRYVWGSKITVWCYGLVLYDGKLLLYDGCADAESVVVIYRGNIAVCLNCIVDVVERIQSFDPGISCIMAYRWNMSYAYFSEILLSVISVPQKKNGVALVMIDESICFNNNLLYRVKCNMLVRVFMSCREPLEVENKVEVCWEVHSVLEAAPCYLGSTGVLFIVSKFNPYQLFGARVPNVDHIHAIPTRSFTVKSFFCRFAILTVAQLVEHFLYVARLSGHNRVLILPLHFLTYDFYEDSRHIKTLSSLLTGTIVLLICVGDYWLGMHFNILSGDIFSLCYPNASNLAIRELHAAETAFFSYAGDQLSNVYWGKVLRVSVGTASPLETSCTFFSSSICECDIGFIRPHKNLTGCMCQTYLVGYISWYAYVCLLVTRTSTAATHGSSIISFVTSFEAAGVSITYVDTCAPVKLVNKYNFCSFRLLSLSEATLTAGEFSSLHHATSRSVVCQSNGLSLCSVIQIPDKLEVCIVDTVLIFCATRIYKHVHSSYREDKDLIRMDQAVFTQMQDSFVLTLSVVNHVDTSVTSRDISSDYSATIVEDKVLYISNLVVTTRIEMWNSHYVLRSQRFSLHGSVSNGVSGMKSMRSETRWFFDPGIVHSRLVVVSVGCADTKNCSITKMAFTFATLELRNSEFSMLVMAGFKASSSVCLSSFKSYLLTATAQGPYQQQSTVSLSQNLKLAPRSYGPYRILARVGKVAYHVALPAESTIHPIIHVFQLQRLISPTATASLQLPLLSDLGEPILQPYCVLASTLIHCHNDWIPHLLIQGTQNSLWTPLGSQLTQWPCHNVWIPHLLIQWNPEQPLDATWEPAHTMASCCPEF